MRAAPDFKLISFLMMFILTSCTSSFEPRLTSLDMTKNRLPTAKKVQAGVEVSIEEFFTPNKSRRAFDADIGSQGILPILVRIENKGSEIYRVQQNQVRAFLEDQQLPPLYAHEAATHGASRDYVWNSLVNTAAMGPLAIYFGVAGLGFTASQGRSINAKVEHHLEALELQDSLLKPDDTAAGFVYFHLPPSTKRLERLIVEVNLDVDPSAQENAKTLHYRLPLPIVEIR
jgi:hypothetical protein